MLAEIDCDERTVMRPKLVRIGNSCYRRLDHDVGYQTIDDYNVPTGSTKRSKQSGTQLMGQFPPVLKHLQSNKMQRYLIDELERDDEEDFGDDDFDPEQSESFQLNDGEELNQDEQGNQVLRLHVCSTFFGYIIGKRAQTKQLIESETGTFLKIPPAGGFRAGGRSSSNNNKEHPDANFIQITGRNKRDLIAAQKRIANLVNSSRNKQNFTHFLSIPLGTDLMVRDRFNEFKRTILADPNMSVAKNIDESVFQVDTRLHLTIRIFYLGDQYERDRAMKLLQEFNQQFLQKFLSDNELTGETKLKLRIRGLNMMNDDPAAVNVLYAKVAEEDQPKHRGFLQTILDALFDWFESSGLTIADRNQTNVDTKVKVHCTLMNSRYRNSNRNRSNQRDQKSPVDDPNEDVAEVEAEVEESTTVPEDESQCSNSSKRKRKNLKMDCTTVLEKFGDFDFGTVELNQIHFSSPRFFDSDSGYYRSLGKIEF